MTRKLTTLVAALAMLMTMLGTGAFAASDRGDQARAEHQRIVDFWTPERIAQAVPRDFVIDGRGWKAKPENPGKPGGGGGGGGGDNTVTGASWNGGGEVADTTGKILFALGSSYYVCSGSVATESVSGRSVVVSAGHCVFDETNGQFATNWMFIPDYDSAPAPLDTQGTFCAQTEWGCWTATSLVVHEGYATAGGFNDQAVQYDWGFAVMGNGGHANTQLDATVGSQAVSFASVTIGTTVSAFGYPAAQKYKGNDLVYCQGPVGTDPNTDDLTYGVTCNMTGGSSGGPWFAPFDNGTGTGTQMSVNSYGYSGVKSMFGPMFNSNTQDTWNTALTTNGNAVVD
jgi:hypothetical protein